MVMKPKNMKPKEYIRQRNDAIITEDWQKYIHLISHQVRWLYNNNNKCTLVIDEKEAHRMQQNLQLKINKLKEDNIKLKTFIEYGLETGYVFNPNDEVSSFEIIENILN